jgi:hypothetical protein
MIFMLLRRFNKREKEIGEFSGFICVISFMTTCPLPCGQLHSSRDRESYSSVELQNTRTLAVSEYLTQYLINWDSAQCKLLPQATT